MESFTDLNPLDARSTLLGVAVFLVLYWLLRRHPSRNLPPGPKGWPVLGNLPQLARMRAEPHRYFSNLAARYGNVISVNLAGNLIVVLHGADVIREAFNQPQLSARPRLYVSEKLRPGVGIFISSGAIWTELRRFCLKVLRGFGMGKSSFEENIATEALFLTDEWKKVKGAPLDPKHMISQSISNVICAVVFGERFQYTDVNFRYLIQYSDDVFEQIGAGGVVDFTPLFAKLTFLPFVRKYKDATQALIDQICRMVDTHNQDFDADNIRDFTDAFLQEESKHGGTSDVFSRDNMKRVVADLFGAGTETTTTTLHWSILYMMAYPEVQARVQKELDDVTGRNRFPRMSDKPDLPYTEAVICEIQRISTIVPLSVPHFCSEDTTLLGYDIPKGTVVLSNLWHCHYDPTIWREPETFRPERFLEDEKKFIKCEELTPFGIGRRICLGEHLARMELFIFFTLLLHEFTFKNPPDAPPVTFDGIDTVTWAPKKFKVCVIPRA
ncbi:cytochrome P450 2J6-like [Acanthaster planci]|uniref:Cytochrome P450 2J6-like n=1 Tax=Acanthaster planci TaxID=133434 RepID=A0A8B7XQC4_ACAPL|nr:cytochrome P450 2J6-like [Acanthaster planci]